MYDVDINIIDVYAKKYTTMFRRHGLNPDYDEVYQELAEAYVIGCQRWNSNQGAKQKTLVVACFKNKMKDYGQRELTVQRERARLQVDLDQEEFENHHFCMIENWSIAISDLMSNIDGFEKIIVAELIAPSEQVKRTSIAIKAKNKLAGKDKLHANSALLAIAITYDKSWRSTRKSAGEAARKINKKKA